VSKVSVIIPSRNDSYLEQTVTGLLEGAAGDVEVIVVLDGPPWETELPKDRRIKVLCNERAGMRATINAGAAVAKGKYLLKCDEHCMFAAGWDETLKADCADNWLVVPARYALDAPNWQAFGEVVEAMFMVYPYLSPYRPKLTCRPWPERARERKDYPVDEDMGFQGSAWFMTRKHWDRLGGLNEAGYGTFVSEPEELGLKTWLGPWDGAVMRNKRTWYAHWSKPQSHWRQTPGYIGWVSEKEWWDGWAYSADLWLHNRWPERGHDFEWFVEKFWPIPHWPEDWLKRKYDRYKQAITR